MSELTNAIAMLNCKFPTAIQKVNHPIHKGQPNPVHGKFYFVGSVPVACHKVYYDTEAEAIQAAIDNGATRIQRNDCSFVTL